MKVDLKQVQKNLETLYRNFQDAQNKYIEARKKVDELYLCFKIKGNNPNTNAPTVFYLEYCPFSLNPDSYSICDIYSISRRDNENI